MGRLRHVQQRFALLGSVALLAAGCATTSAPQVGVASPPEAAAAPTAAATEVAAPTVIPTLAATAAPTSAPQAATQAPTASPPTPTPAPTQITLKSFDPALAATLQGILDQTVANSYIPGAVLSVSIKGYEPWTGASGVAERQTGRAMEPATNVRIASLSKMFTSVVVQQLAEEGAINLDAPMSTYLPNLLRNGDAITVRMLLQQTTGLYDYLEDRRYVVQAYQNPQRVFEPSELVAYATRFPPAFAPGTPGAWDYSSTNYVILGMLVEQVTGNPLGQEVQQRIFDPLGLSSTYFAPSDRIPASAARGYSQSVDQTNVAMSFVFATASLVSTASDVRRFMEGLLGGELLQPESLNAMLTFVNGKGQYGMPSLEYGLGIMRNVLPVGAGPNGQPRPAEASTVVGHIGGFGGFRAATWASPADGITIALGVNQAATDPNTLATRVYDAILTYQGR